AATPLRRLLPATHTKQVSFGDSTGEGCLTRWRARPQQAAIVECAARDNVYKYICFGGARRHRLAPIHTISHKHVISPRPGAALALSAARATAPARRIVGLSAIR